jgi:hypothetical protein
MEITSRGLAVVEISTSHKPSYMESRNPGRGASCFLSYEWLRS